MIRTASSFFLFILVLKDMAASKKIFEKNVQPTRLKCTIDLKNGLDEENG